MLDQGSETLANTQGTSEVCFWTAGISLLLAVTLWIVLIRQDLAGLGYPGLFVICAVLSATMARRAYGDLISPIALMALGWIGPVVLYSLDLSPLYLPQFRAESWWIVIASLLLFDLGAVIAIGRSCGPGSQRKVEERSEDTSPMHAGYVLYVYFALGLIAWLYKVWSLGGFSAIVLFSDEPDFVRWQELPRIIGQMPIFLLIVPLLCLARWESEGFKQQKFLLLLAALSTATLVLDTARSNIYQAVFVGLLFWKCRRGRLPVKKLAIIFTCCVLLFIAVSSQRFAVAGDSAQQMIDEVGVLRPLALPYIYLTTSLANLQLNFDEGRATYDGGGVRTFMPLLSWLQVYKPEQIGNYVSDWPGGISLYQADFWIDFAWLGVVLGPAAFGLICGWAYRRMRLRNTSLHTMVYAVLATSVVASGFVNWFNSPVTWFLVLLIPLALSISSAKRATASQRASASLAF